MGKTAAARDYKLSFSIHRYTSREWKLPSKLPCLRPVSCPEKPVRRGRAIYNLQAFSRWNRSICKQMHFHISCSAVHGVMSFAICVHKKIKKKLSLVSMYVKTMLCFGIAKIRVPTFFGIRFCFKMIFDSTCFDSIITDLLNFLQLWLLSLAINASFYKGLLARQCFLDSISYT